MYGIFTYIYQKKWTKCSWIYLPYMDPYNAFLGVYFIHQIQCIETDRMKDPAMNRFPLSQKLDDFLSSKTRWALLNQLEMG